MVQILTMDQGPEPKLIQEDLDEYKAMRALAQSYSTQSRRLQHVANRLRVMMKLERSQHHSSRASFTAAGRHRPSQGPQSWKSLDDLNKRTMEVVLRGVAANDPEATQRVHDAEEKVRIKPEMAYSAVKRAFDWHEKQASILYAQVDTLMTK